MSELPAKDQSADEIVKLREKVTELEKSVEHLTYAISHDLRAPLRAVQGFSQALQEDFAPQLNPEAQRYLSIIEASSKQMTQMIEAILTLSRLGRQPVHISVVNMQELVNEQVMELEKKLESTRLQFRVGQLPPASGDAMLLRQVWANLISNAVKFTGTKPVPVIEIGGRVEADQKVYFIRDNGIGFDQTYDSKLFTLFQRLHNETGVGGVGAGLAIVQLLIRRQGGRVWAEGKLGEGATFYFSLPE